MQLEKLPYFFQRKSEPLAPANKMDGFQVRLAVIPVAGKRSGRLTKQPSPLIKAHGLHIQARFAG